MTISWNDGKRNSGNGNEQGTLPLDHGFAKPSTTAKEHNFTADAQWNAIPAAERFELLATIREMRDWRYGELWPPLQPIRRAALELHHWRHRAMR